MTISNKISMPCAQGTMTAFTTYDNERDTDSIVVMLTEPDGTARAIASVTSHADGIGFSVTDENIRGGVDMSLDSENEFEVLPGQMTIFDVLDPEEDENEDKNEDE